MCEYLYPGGNLSFWDLWALSLSVAGAGGIPGGDGVSSGGGCLCRSDGGALISFRLQHVGRFILVPFWQRKAPGHLFLMALRWVAVNRSLHHFMPKTLNSLLLLFSDFGAKILNQVLRFLSCGARNASLCYFGHIQCQAHVRLFQLDPTSLPCHSSRHVENLQEISCCL